MVGLLIETCQKTGTKYLPTDKSDYNRQHVHKMTPKNAQIPGFIIFLKIKKKLWSRRGIIGLTIILTILSFHVFNIIVNRGLVVDVIHDSNNGILAQYFQLLKIECDRTIFTRSKRVFTWHGHFNVFTKETPNVCWYLHPLFPGETKEPYICQKSISHNTTVCKETLMTVTWYVVGSLENKQNGGLSPFQSKLLESLAEKRRKTMTFQQLLDANTYKWKYAAVCK